MSAAHVTGHLFEAGGVLDQPMRLMNLLAAYQTGIIKAREDQHGR